MSHPVSDETIPERGVVRVTYPTLRFYTPFNISGMAEAIESSNFVLL